MIQRLFVGVPCQAASPISSLLDELKLSSAATSEGLRVLDPSMLHITLQFLGATPLEQQPEIEHAMDRALRNIGRFEAHITGAGQFGDALWLGVAGHPLLSDMAARCQREFAAVGFALEEKRFRPHITVARLRRSSKFDGHAWANKYHATHWGALEVASAHLYLSELLPDGARYTVLHTTALH
jgi:RNA 2',3'-cyclic 3'-phosphodiesterase